MEIGSEHLRPLLERVASTEPVPGGGSVAAVACALGGSLAAMVASLTASKPRYAEVRNEMEALAAEANELWGECLALARDDSAAYAAFAEALRLPKGSPEEANRRGSAISHAADGAASVPLEVCRRARRLLDLLGSAHGRTLAAASTDLASGAALAEAALKAASLNVLVNLSSIDSDERRETLLEECTRLLAEGSRQADNIDTAVRASLTSSG